MILRQFDLIQATLMPNLPKEVIEKEVKRLDLNLYEIDHEEQIEEAERDMREHIDKRKKRRR